VRTNLPTISRFALSVGFLVSLGLTFVPSGGCGGAQPVAEMPVRFAEPIRACAVMHEHHLTASDHLVKFDVGLVNGQVDSIVLVQSTLQDEELETCLARAIRSFTVDDLPLRVSANLERDVASPQSRELLGNPAVPLAACLASPPCVLALGVVIMGTVVVTVQLTVYSATTTAPITATPATTATPVPTTTATATPTATATTTTTSPPIAVPRRWPGQTCENKQLDALEAAKDLVCTGFPGKSCSSSGKNAPFLPVYPCSLLKARIPAVLACVAARQRVQDECFKGSPHAGHAQQIDDLSKGIVLCEALKVINCAPGHPMAGL
jgi:hypothetical protein